jgi:futalosine hydrolase
MSKKILYVTATNAEADSLKMIMGMEVVPGGYRFGSLEIRVLVTGVGSISTAWAMKQWLSANGKPDLAINAGIAGSYKDDIETGSVVMPVTDCFADAGMEDGNNFLTLFEAGLADPNEFPFKSGLLYSDSRYIVGLKGSLNHVSAVTVNTATGSDSTRNKLVQKFNPDIETMEVATFFYICIREKIPFLALRSISNRVELRDKSKWNITLALDSLSEKLGKILKTLD